MFILNPPYTLEPTLREVMPYLVKVLGKDAGATFAIERGAQVTGTATTRLGANGTVRMPVGNARRASPTSGTGSLRLPGQAPAGTPARQPPARSGRASVRPARRPRRPRASVRPARRPHRPAHQCAPDRRQPGRASGKRPQ